MKMLSVFNRMVENEGRTVIRSIEWFLRIREEQEKTDLTPPASKTESMGPLSLQHSKAYNIRQFT